MKLIIYTIALFIFSTKLIAQLGDRFYGSGVFQGIQPSGDGGYFVAGWQSAPVSEISAWLVFVVVPLVVLRLALTWSMRRDRRGQT